VVAMGLRATLAQSDISTKLTIAAKAFSGSVTVLITSHGNVIETLEHKGDFKEP
jgi:hypothetical protein